MFSSQFLSRPCGEQPFIFFCPPQMTDMWSCIKVKGAGLRILCPLYFDFDLQPCIIVTFWSSLSSSFFFLHYLSTLQSLLYLSLSHMPLLLLHFRTCRLHFLVFFSFCYFALRLISLSLEYLLIPTFICSCISVLCLFIAVIFLFFLSHICSLVSLTNYSTDLPFYISQKCYYSYLAYLSNNLHFLSISHLPLPNL